MRLRSMVDKDKDKEDNRGEGTTHDGEGPDIMETVTPVPTDQTQEWSDGLDDIDRAVRVSSRKVRTFWYIPDLKNTQLKNIRESRLQHPNDPMHILINAPELKRFFKTSTFEISIDSGRMYTYVARAIGGGPFSYKLPPKLAISRNMAGIGIITQQ